MDKVSLANERQYEEHTLSSAVKSENGWTLSFDKGSSLFINEFGADFNPKKGQKVRLYGKGFGYPVRGVVVDDVVAYYRTEEEEKARFEEQKKESARRKRAEYEEKKEDLHKRAEALPAALAARFTRFQAKNPEFWPEFGGYELFCCEQACLIAAAFKADKRLVDRWSKMQFTEQKELVPGLSEEHSGNTFGFATSIARLLALGREDEAGGLHGALAPLVGCAAYGCHGQHA